VSFDDIKQTTARELQEQVGVQSSIALVSGDAASDR
jgi:hypothetical protein